MLSIESYHPSLIIIIIIFTTSLFLFFLLFSFTQCLCALCTLCSLCALFVFFSQMGHKRIHKLRLLARAMQMNVIHRVLSSFSHHYYHHLYYIIDLIHSPLLVYSMPLCSLCSLCSGFFVCFL